MNKTLFALLCLAFLGTLVNADCTNTVLTDEFGFGAPADNNAPDIEYCASLIEGGATCCADEVINAFQDDTDTLVERLSDSAGERDVELINTRGYIIGNATLLEAFLANFTAAQETLVDEESTLADDLQDMVYKIGNFSSNLTGLRDEFEAYQTARQACITQIVKLQAAAWCAACTPSVADYFDSDVLSPNEDIRTRIGNACRPFFTAAAAQNIILELGEFLLIVEDLNDALVEIADAEDQTAAISAAETVYAGLGTASTTTHPCPTGTGACDWIFATAFRNQIAEEDSLILGGTPPDRRLLSGRSLAINAWEPEEDEAGVDVAFPKNPANVTNEVPNSAKLAGVVACLVAGFITLFF